MSLKVVAALLRFFAFARYLVMWFGGYKCSVYLLFVDVGEMIVWHFSGN